MEKVYISNQVKYDILTICGQSTSRSYDLLTDTPLYLIGYAEDSELCAKLEQQLRSIANEYNTGKSIEQGAVSGNLTVRQCIQMVM